MTYHNKKLLAFAKEAPICFGCGCENDGTVVSAHANWQEYGKGMGEKANDWAIAELCVKCHELVDRVMGREEAKEFWIRAHVRTLTWLFENGWEITRK